MPGLRHAFGDAWRKAEMYQVLHVHTKIGSAKMSQESDPWILDSTFMSDPKRLPFYKFAWAMCGIPCASHGRSGSGRGAFLEHSRIRTSLKQFRLFSSPLMRLPGSCAMPCLINCCACRVLKRAVSQSCKGPPKTDPQAGDSCRLLVHVSF